MNITKISMQNSWQRAVYKYFWRTIWYFHFPTVLLLTKTCLVSHEWPSINLAFLGSISDILSSLPLSLMKKKISNGVESLVKNQSQIKGEHEAESPQLSAIWAGLHWGELPHQGHAPPPKHLISNAWSGWRYKAWNPHHKSGELWRVFFVSERRGG